ncbi:hypothetical protein N0B16_06390 [Chryseobacterium sp. GMJ5]|uniref:Carboxypeptidase regulatory-like domain-containing protein n=1 Tax=Chryseobacterium gilvum TaxID=2976534 RepID=A0ABT2VW05_9FLAO|nr:hypothetical protein [Chryseobacterium gilvum]MCU7614061.1 hypothetical protein [Chryseobacterium gilvum]
MMKKIFILTLFCFSFYLLQGQKIKIEGFVKQPPNARLSASIVINDTINKLAKLDSNNYARRNKIYDEKKLVATSNDNGYFTITARKSDSIFFRFDRLYYSEKYSVSDLLQCKEIILEPQPIPCLSRTICNQKKPSKIYAFVGKKIDVSVDTTLYCDEIMDIKYRAVYKIDQQLIGHYNKPIMIFDAYDHSSKYEYDFNNYVDILVFVGEFCGDLIKDDFFPVYKTTDGRWATPVDAYMENHYKNTEIKPIPISFDKSLTYDYPTDLSEQQLEWRFPKEYYKTKNGKAYPIKGRYAEDLVKLWNERKSKYKE